MNLIVAHTNETEYRSFIANKKNEALHSRIIVMPVPYNLKVSQEEKIYEKMIRESDVARCPYCPAYTKGCCNVYDFNTVKRTEKGDIDLLKKMRLYDGENVEGFNSDGCR